MRKTARFCIVADRTLYADMEATAIDFEERLDRLVEGFLVEASRRPNARQIADGAHYSIAQTHRIFRDRFGESPGAFRRRLVLERAAEMLRSGDVPVWKAALESGYDSPEAFARAFQRAFRSAPRSFKGALTQGWLPAPNAIHFWRGGLVKSMDQGGKKMNLMDRMIEHDLIDTRRLIESAARLQPEQLDESMPEPLPRLFLECGEVSLRDKLDRLVITKEIWLAAVFARTMPSEERDKSPDGLLARWNTAEAEWRKLVKNVSDENKWDTLFIDGLCSPPETFSFGGMIAHVLTNCAHRRAEAQRSFAHFGVEDSCYGDPMIWEQRLAAAQPTPPA